MLRLDRRRDRREQQLKGRRRTCERLPVVLPVEVQGGLEGLGEPRNVGPPAPPGEAGILVVLLRPIPRAGLGVLPPARGSRLHHDSRRRGRRLLFALVLWFASRRGGWAVGE